MTTYYKHSNQYGSEYLVSVIKIEPENKVTINLYSRMCFEKLKYVLTCTLLPVSGPYNIIRIDLFNDGTGEYKNDAYFDTYIFNEILDTECYKHPIDDVPNHLYMRNVSRTTEKFQLQMFNNTRIVSNVSKHTKLSKVVKILNGLKYEVITKHDYDISRF